jgi:predicted Zn-dependent peptidase
MPNSLNFITNTKKIFHIIVYFPAGSIYEDEKTRGISHLLEHMMMKHTKKFTEMELLKEGTAIGGNWNAETDRDLTCYYMMTHMDNYKKCIDIMHSCTREPVFTEYEFNIELKVVIEELNKNIDRHSDMDNLSYLSVLSQSNPYSKPIEGYVKTLNSITIDDLHAYMKRRYKQEMVFINCEGGAKKKEVEKYVEKLFGKSKRIDFNEEPMKKQVEGSKKSQGDIYVISKPLKQCQVQILFPTYPRHMTRENLLIEFIKFCLVECGLYSILMTELRTKRGLVYGVQSQNETYRYMGVFRINISTSSKDADYIIGLVLDELMKICKNGFSPKMLAYFKKSFINARKYFMTNEVHRSIVIGETLFYGKELQKLDIMKSITNTDIIKIANDIFDLKAMGILAYGDYKDSEERGKINNLVLTYKNMHVK